MRESVAVAKEADREKEFSPTKSDNDSIHRAQHEPERQLGSMRGVIGNIRRDGGMPSVESIATELSGMSTGGRAPALLALQQTHGNRYVQRVVSGIQAKLVVGQPNDIYEQEADRVADAVMRMPEPQVQRQVELEEEEEEIQTKPLPSQTSEVVSDVETSINSIRGGGQPLPGSTRAFFEPRFGQDFSQVRVHTDTQGVELARAVNARAFTVGHDVVFGAGQYAPGTSEGRRLMAHELTHVVQQGRQAGIANRVVNYSQFATRPDILLKSPIIIQRRVADKDFFDYFKSCMGDLGMPTPSSLFQTIGATIATIASINAAVATFGTEVTIGELIGAGTLGEGLLAAGGILASAYVGVCIGCLGTAAGQSLSGGYGLGDALFDLIGPKPGLWIAETFGI